MADLASDAFAAGDMPARGRRGLLPSVAGAVLATLALAAAGAWAWELSARDPGEIPFLRADPAPMKTTPEDGGGLTLGRSERAVTRIMEGEAPDSGGGALGPAAEAPAPEDLPSRLLTRDADAPAPAPAVAPRPDGAIDAAVSEAIAEAAAAVARGGGAAEAEAAREVDEPDASRIAPASAPAAPRRPAGGAAAVAAATPAAAEAAAASPDLATGDVAVQLGAFNSAEIAADQWRRHLGRNDDLLRDLDHAVTQVRSGGRLLHRLRAGPLPGVARAQELCAALEARGDACIPVTVR